MSFVEKTGADPAHLIITIKLSSNRLDFRLPYDDAEELSESQTLMTLMAYEVKNDVSGIASIRGPIREPLDKVGAFRLVFVTLSARRDDMRSTCICPQFGSCSRITGWLPQGGSEDRKRACPSSVC